MAAEPTGLEHVTPVKIKDTSATERGMFRRCRRQWFLMVAHHLQTIGGNENLWVGTLVHAGLEGYYKYLMDARWKSSMREHVRRDIHLAAVAAGFDMYELEAGIALDKLREELGFLWPMNEQRWLDLAELGFNMIANYFDREEKDPIFDEIVDVEHRLDIPIRSPKGRKIGSLSVRTDLVGRRDGILAVADHKTYSRDVQPAQLDLDDQLTAECYAVLMYMDEWPEEAVYNGLAKRAPGPPRRLKDGKGGKVKLSQAKDQGTTYAEMMDAINEHGLDPEEYRGFLNYLWNLEKTDESPFFRRERVLRSQEQLASFEASLYQEWIDIRAVARHPEKAYPNPSPFSCPSCPVKTICLAMNDDGDVSAIIRADFVVGDPRR